MDFVNTSDLGKLIGEKEMLLKSFTNPLDLSGIKVRRRVGGGERMKGTRCTMTQLSDSFHLDVLDCLELVIIQHLALGICLTDFVIFCFLKFTAY